jgi:hypothetical protein
LDEGTNKGKWGKFEKGAKQRRRFFLLVLFLQKRCSLIRLEIENKLKREQADLTNQPV